MACKDMLGLKTVYITESSDWMTDKKTGERRLKRKYGDRKRKVLKYEIEK